MMIQVTGMSKARVSSKIRVSVRISDRVTEMVSVGS